jgi:hypothetical protein
MEQAKDDWNFLISAYLRKAEMENPSSGEKSRLPLSR